MRSACLELACSQLGYAVSSNFIAERMFAKRRAMGWSVKEAARQLGIEADTWKTWEQDEVILYRNHRLSAARLLDLPKREADQDTGVRWNRLHK